MYNIRILEKCWVWTHLLFLHWHHILDRLSPNIDWGEGIDSSKVSLCDYSIRGLKVFGQYSFDIIWLYACYFLWYPHHVIEINTRTKILNRRFIFIFELQCYIDQIEYLFGSLFKLTLDKKIVNHLRLIQTQSCKTSGHFDFSEFLFFKSFISP